MTVRVTSDELYAQWVALITAITGLPAWRKGGIQAIPQGPYATIMLTEGPSPAQDVKDLTENEDGFTEQPWGQTRLACKAEFFKADAQKNALRFRDSLQVTERFFDIWKICGLVGEIVYIDLSTMFRADIENRAEVRFNIYANISEVISQVGLIESQQVSVMDSQNITVADVTITVPIEEGA